MPSRNNHSRRRSSKHKLHKKSTRKSNRKMHKKSKTHKNTRKHTRKSQRGGFYSNAASCSLATVQEPGFSIPAIGDVPGFSLSNSKGAIHRPNCKSDTYQAMTP